MPAELPLGPIPFSTQTDVDGLAELRFELDRPLDPGIELELSIVDAVERDQRDVDARCGLVPPGRFTVSVFWADSLFSCRMSAREPSRASCALPGRSAALRRAFPGRGLVRFDLDGDGDQDLVVCNLGASAALALEDRGEGTFVVPRTIGLVTDPYLLALTDLDGDGIVDLVASDRDREVTVAMCEGAFSFRTPKRYPAGRSPFGLITADTDGDGDADVLLATRTGNSVVLLENRCH